MEVQELKGYWRRNWWILLSIIVFSSLISRAIPHGHAHILFFILFLCVAMYALHRRERKIQLLYKAYGEAVYCAEKVDVDLLTFIDNLQTVGLVLAAKDTLLERFLESSAIEENAVQAEILKRLDEINLSLSLEKVMRIIDECIEMVRQSHEGSEELKDFIALLEWMQELAVNGYFRTREEVYIRPDVITERLILDNQRLALPEFTEVNHHVQATINLFLLKSHMGVKEIGEILENLKIQLNNIIEGEVLDCKLRIERYLKEAGPQPLVHTRIRRNG